MAILPGPRLLLGQEEEVVAVLPIIVVGPGGLVK
jgi:hypothetical protein